MINICVLADYKVKIITKYSYEEIIDYYLDTGAITKNHKETVRKQKTMCGGKLLEFIASIINDKDCFEVMHNKDDELTIVLYNPIYNMSETTKIIKWEIKDKGDLNA